MFSLASSMSGRVIATGLTLALLLLAGAAQAQRGGGQGHAGFGAPMSGASMRGGPSFGGPGFGIPSAAPDNGPPGASLQAFLFGTHPAERRALRYRGDDGDAFVLDRASGAALLKFEDSQEVWSLTPTAGPRGDTIFKNDVGDPVLRMTRLGGVTLFTDARPDGMPVAVAGAAASLRPNTSIGPNALFQAMAQSSVRASRAAQHLIPFVVVPDVTAKTDWLFADAAMVASEAFLRLVAQAPDGRAFAARFARVEFLTGSTVQAATQGPVVQITLAPNKGVAGRPSSKRIYLVLRRR